MQYVFLNVFESTDYFVSDKLWTNLVCDSVKTSDVYGQKCIN